MAGNCSSVREWAVLANSVFFTQNSDFDEVFETYNKKRLLEISDNVIDNFKYENEIDY